MSDEPSNSPCLTCIRKSVSFLFLADPTNAYAWIIHTGCGLEFPNPVSFCKPGFSGLGKVKPGFRVRVRVWKSRRPICVHCKLEGEGYVAL